MIKNKIELLYKDYLQLKDFVEVKTKESKNISNLIDLDEIKEQAINRYVDLFLFSKDSQIIFSDLICLIEFFKESQPSETLPKDIEDFFLQNRDWKPKRVSETDSNSVFIPEEILEVERQKFLESPLFNSIKTQIESSLNQ